MDPTEGEDQDQNQPATEDQTQGGADVPDDEDDLLADLGDDQGEGDDEGQDDEQDEGDDEGQNQNAGQQHNGQQPSRRTIRVQKLERERDEEREQRAALQARLDAVLAGQTNQQTEAARQAEAERIAKMDPAEREKYQSDQKIRQLEAQVQNLGFAQTDGLDRARFEAKAELNPIYKKYAPQVERTLQEMRAKGVNATRESILTYKLGEAARKKLEAGSGQSQRRKDAAQGRVNKAQGKPANLRGDSGTQRRGDNVEDRLRGVQI